MENFISDLRQQIENHNLLIGRANYCANLLSIKHNIDVTKKILYEYELYKYMFNQLFIKIVSNCYNYATVKQINCEQLENEFRNNQLNIYIIARKFTNINNSSNVMCVLNGSSKEYEANFVITDDTCFYKSELQKFGYADYRDNHNNLKNCGMLVVGDTEDAIENYPNDKFILNDNI